MAPSCATSAGPAGLTRRNSQRGSARKQSVVSRSGARPRHPPRRHARRDLPRVRIRGRLVMRAERHRRRPRPDPGQLQMVPGAALAVECERLADAGGRAQCLNRWTRSVVQVLAPRVDTSDRRPRATSTVSGALTNDADLRPPDTRQSRPAGRGRPRSRRRIRTTAEPDGLPLPARPNCSSDEDGQHETVAGESTYLRTHGVPGYEELLANAVEMTFFGVRSGRGVAPTSSPASGGEPHKDQAALPHPVRAGGRDRRQDKRESKCPR